MIWQHTKKNLTAHLWVAAHRLRNIVLGYHVTFGKIESFGQYYENKNIIHNNRESIVVVL